VLRPPLEGLEDEEVERALEQLDPVLVAGALRRMDVDRLHPWVESVYSLLRQRDCSDRFHTEDLSQRARTGRGRFYLCRNHFSRGDLSAEACLRESG
jgi:hypothetical protein